MDPQIYRCSLHDNERLCVSEVSEQAWIAKTTATTTATTTEALPDGTAAVVAREDDGRPYLLVVERRQQKAVSVWLYLWWSNAVNQPCNEAPRSQAPTAGSQAGAEDEAPVFT